jgi:hypothetical protein
MSNPTICPDCLPHAISHLTNQQGTYETFCVNSSTRARGPHKWDDREMLNARLAAAKAAFPQFYTAPAAPPPAAAPRDMHIDPETKQALEQLVGQPINGAGELKGVVFEAVRRAKDLDIEVTKLKATVNTMQKHRAAGTPAGALAPNQVVFDVPEWAEAVIDGMAEYAGKTRQQWVGDTFTEFIETFCTAQQGR